MLRVAVVEDDEKSRNLLRDMIGRYAGEHQMEIRTDEFADGREIVENYTPDYDILLFDVVMVFITNMAQYAIKGYEVDALDFILKPVSYETFSMRFTRAAGRVKNREGKRLTISLPDGTKWIDSRKIFYVETQNRMLVYHTEDGVFSVRGALKDVQRELEECHFVKCNQCYLVNLRYVTEIRKNVAVVAGDELEISRRNRNAFLAAVTDFLGS